MKNKDKPFHVIFTNGILVLGCDSLEYARQYAQNLNHHALDNGISDRYVAIPKPDTPEEEP